MDAKALLFCDICNGSIPKGMASTELEGRTICAECWERLNQEDPVVVPLHKVLSVASRWDRSQPEEKIVTISRIKDSSCPHRYFKEYVESPKGKKAFESIEAGLGNFFHSYLASHFREIMARNASISSKDLVDVNDCVLKFRLSMFWEGRPRPPYRIVRSTYSPQDFLLRLQRVAQNFNAYLQKRLVGHKPLYVEGELQIRTANLCVRGKYDLITQGPSGKLVLWDWKSGRAPERDYFEEFLNQKMQLGIYAVWMKHTCKTEAVRGTVVFLREEVKELSETFTPTVEADVLEYVSNWRQRVNSIGSYVPIPNSLCDWCGWNPDCPAYGQVF